MRLKTRQREMIRSAVKRHFGQDAGVWLFGSRVNDVKRGGDIDILVQPGKQAAEDWFMRKIHVLSELKRVFGDRKIDIVVEHKNDTRSVVRKAHAEGMRL